MNLTSATGLKFELIEGGRGSNTVEGKFSILDGEKSIGTVDISTFNGTKYVSASMPDTNLTMNEWTSLFSQMKERFRLSEEQKVIVNK